MSARRVGYRFRPTDEELIAYFLVHKMDGSDHLVDEDVREVELLKHEPWDLPRLSAMEETDDQEWYFFCRRDSSRRQCRMTVSGYWKSTGKDRVIKTRRTKKEIGTKKTLVFHEGRFPNGVKTNWTIHEYQSKTVDQTRQTPYVLCKLMKKIDEKTDAAPCNEAEPVYNPPPALQDAPLELIEEDPELLEAMLRSCEGGSSPYQPYNEVLFNFEGEYSIEFANSVFISDDELLGHSSSCLSRVPAHSLDNEWSSEQIVRIFGQRESFPPARTSNLPDGHAVAKGYRQMRTVALTGNLPSLNHDENGTERIAFHGDESPATETSPISSDTLDENLHLELFSEESSSGGSTTNTTRGVNEQIHKEFSYYANPRTSKYQPRFGNSVAEKRNALTIGQSRGKSSHTESKKVATNFSKPVATVGLRQKEGFLNLVKHDNVLQGSMEDQKMVNAKASLKNTKNGFSGETKRGSSIRQSTQPPSVYIINVIVGVFLFVVVSREVLIFH